MAFKFTLLIVCLLLCRITFGQGTMAAVSVNYNQAKIDTVVTDLETKTLYHFYYEKAAFDTLRITLKIQRQSLSSILDHAFKNTGFYYTINNNNVYLTVGRALEFTLADGFFGDKPLTTPAQKAGANSGLLIFGDANKGNNITAATTENKIYEIGVLSANTSVKTATIAGYIKDIKTGEPAIGANIYVADSKLGAATDKYGFYSLTLPKGRHTLDIKVIGSKDTRRQIILNGDGRLNIELQEQVQTLKEVKISADKVANVQGAQMGAVRMDIKSIKEIPSVFGETDVLRAVTLLPGVQTVGEATTGFNVRGGSADQNLILLNGSTVYNPAHFFGFFSAFNPDLVKEVELYKSTIPEKLGGRLSSVLDVTNREGNKKQFTGSAGIGLLTSRLNVEGPIVTDKTSFSFGGRVTYSDWLLKFLPDEYKNSAASFYDFNLDLVHQINDKNTLYANGYLSQDKFRLNSDSDYAYSNKNIILKWKHNFNNKLYSLISGGFDRYDYSLASQAVPLNAFKLNFDINQSNFKADFNYYPSTQHTITFGLGSTFYRIHPGTYGPASVGSATALNIVQAQQALESALYVGDKFDISGKLSVSAGLRYSLYNFLGPHTVNNYAANTPRGTETFTDSVRYGNNKIINTYNGPEIRLSARYNLADNLSVKAGYNTLRQYIHLLSNSTAISPTDVYQLSDPNIKPQTGDQISLGMYRNFSSNTIETSVEVYYRHINDYLDYKNGAILLLNHHIETDVVPTKGKAYGIEFLMRKTAGKLTGLISYTYSRTFLRQSTADAFTPVNNGDWYPANYDKPHAFNLTSAYHISHRYSFAFNILYSTGRPITVPTAKYYYAGAPRVFYAERNQNRIPDYFRSDFSITIDGNSKLNQRFHNSWTFGVYNLTGQQNAYSTYFASQGGAINGYKLSIFATAVPFLNYNIRF